MPNQYRNIPAMRTTPCFAGGLATWCAWLGLRDYMGRKTIHVPAQSDEERIRRIRREAAYKGMATKFAKKFGLRVISKSEAKKSGLPRYFTGKPCPKGHISERTSANGACITCQANYVAARRRADPKTHREKAAQYRRERYQADPDFALRARTRAVISTAMLRAGCKKGGKTEQIIGCTFDEFRAHLEKQFLPGMTWANRHLWEVDHIVPVSSATTEDEVLSLNHFTNLRPLWKPHNRRKAANVTHLI